MDFIVKPPPSEGYDAVYVVTDRLTKMDHFSLTITQVNYCGEHRQPQVQTISYVNI